MSVHAARDRGGRDEGRQFQAPGLTLELIGDGVKLDPRQELFCQDGPRSTCATLQLRK